jgi:hypothetical protein
MKIFDDVATQAHRRIGTCCSMGKEDIRQDLLLDAMTDPSLLTQLRATKQHVRRRKLARAFAENARRRRCRKYVVQWPRLNQLQQSDS